MIAAIPGNFNVQQGDGKVFLSWNLIAGATSYTIQRSTDGVTYSIIASPAVNKYLDTTAALGTIYYYQVASTNLSGTSGYTSPQSVVPTMGSEMSLGELGTRCRERADRLNSNFVTLPELNSMINQSQYELYDILITQSEDYFKAPVAVFYSVGGNQRLYPMPNGILTFKDDAGNDFVPVPAYKLLGLDLGLNTSNNGWVTVPKYNFMDRNKFFYPNTASTIYGVFNTSYRWMGANLELIPVPSSGQPFRIQYIPRLPVLLQDTDMTTTSISGWLEYVITDVAIKILQKEESDVMVLAAQKQALIKRIEESSANKDAGRPDTVTDVRVNGSWGSGTGPHGWNHGGF
jgi:hypothetical protein